VISNVDMVLEMHQLGQFNISRRFGLVVARWSFSQVTICWVLRLVS